MTLPANGQAGKAAPAISSHPAPVRPPRPPAPAVEAIPDELKARPQWVVWRYAFVEGKWTKVPYRARLAGRSRAKADTTNPQTWAPFAEALGAYEAFGRSEGPDGIDGIGFVFAADDPYVGVDFDYCLDAGEVAPWAEAWLRSLGTTYAEISPSGRGIKAFYRGTLPPKGKADGRSKGGYGDGTGKIEAYHKSRFFTATGRSCGAPTVEAANPEALAALVEELDGRKAKPATRKADRSNAADIPDDDLIEKIRSSGQGDKFARLFDQGDTSEHGEDDSVADFALLVILAFWTGEDAARMERLFNRSALADREKWDRDDYRKTSIENAIKRNGGNCYQPGVALKSSKALDKPAPLGGRDFKNVRPVIRMTADLHVCVDEASRVLVQAGDIFTRAGQLAKVLRAPAPKPDAKGLRRSENTPIVAILGEALGRVELSRHLSFERFDKRSRDWEPTQPPRDLANCVLALGAYPGGRELAGIIEAPTLRPDGSLLDVPGYDPATCLLYAPNADYPEIPANPSAENVKGAVASLLRLVADFPFATDADRAAWLAYALTILCRPVVEGPVPLFMFSANVAGAGKTYLAKIPPEIATGRPPAMDGYASDDAEMEKRLVAVAMAADPVVVLDNAANGESIGGAALDRAISADGAFRGRVLGKSQMSGDGRRELPWRTVLAVTGNALATKSDTRRRTVPVYLKYEDALPEQRDDSTFAIYRETGLTLKEFITQHRPALVVAAMTIVRAYIALGRPRGGKSLPMGDPFGAWDRTIRHAVLWAYGHDPLGQRGRLAESDETSQQAEALVSAWIALCKALDVDHGEPLGTYAKKGVSVAKAAEALASWNRGPTKDAPPSHPDVLQLFAPFAGRSGPLPDARTLGYALRPVNNVTTCSGTIRSTPPQRGVALWTVASGGDGGDGGDGLAQITRDGKTVTPSDNGQHLTLSLIHISEPTRPY